MAKGFGVKQNEQLGYTLVLLPELDTYAAKFSLDFKNPGERFIGLTNMLEEAQTWKTAKLAEQAIEKYYAAFVLEQLEANPEVRVEIQCVRRSPAGKLEAETVHSIRFQRQS